MSLVLALEPDPKQAAILKQVVRDRVGADVVLVDSKDGAIAAIAERVPDLILVTALLSPRDEADLTDQLRGLDGAEHLQTLTIPLLASGAVESPKPKKRGLLSALTGESPKTAAPIGCEPRVFGEEIRNYLTRAEEAKAAAAAERGRFAKRVAGAGRKRVGGATGAGRGKRPVPPADDEVASAGSYWSWDSSTPAPGVTAAPPPRATAVAPPAPAAAVDPLPPPPHPTSSYSSSWSNPWDVSKTPHAEPPVDAATVLAGAAESTGKPGAAPIIYLDDHQLPADALVPSAAEAAVEQLLSQPATLSAAELVAEAPAPDAAESSTSLSALVAPVAPDVAVPAPAAESGAPHPPRGAHASDEEIDLSSLLEGTPTLSMEPETEPSTDVYTLSTDSFDLSALISQALDRPVQHAAVSDAAEDVLSVGADGLAAESQALLDMKADLDRLRADRENVEHALAEARAAQERAEHAAAEASAKAQEDVERHTREVTARAREEAAAARRTREQQEREALEEAERRLEIERASRAEAERLAREVETRMREEAEAERRLRAEAERQVAEAEATRAREATERRHHQEVERQAREQAEQRAGAERRAREEAEARADAERQAREAAEQKNKDEAARLAQEAEERTSHERRGREQAEARFEAERLAREAAEKKGKEDAERLALEAAEQRRAREAERKSREEAERRAQLEADARAAAEERAREDFERLERERAAQAAREADERKAQQEAERLAREQAEQAALADAERRVAEERKARREAERLARREADRRAEAERRAREEAERVAAEAAVKAKEEARVERKARELAERRVTEERKARELAERKAREEAARRAAAEVRAKKEAEERELERDRRASAKKPVVIRKGKRRPVSASVSKPVPGKEPRPTQDEWGLYDPDKCGFGALFAKLEQLENGDVPDDDRTGEPIRDSGGNGVPSTGRSPRPLSMWAWRASDAPDAPTVPAAPVAPDDFRALVDRLKIPAAVAAVSYASGVRIGRVKIPRRRRGRTAKADAPIIILSRKLLAAARRESAAPTARLTARR